MENTMAIEEGQVMTSQKYSTAGWLAIAYAVLFALSFIIGIMQGVLGASLFGYRGPIIGPADFLSLVSMGMYIYVLLMFRRLLNERYNFTDANGLITAEQSQASRPSQQPSRP